MSHPPPGRPINIPGICPGPTHIGQSSVGSSMHHDIHPVAGADGRFFSAVKDAYNASGLLRTVIEDIIGREYIAVLRNLGPIFSKTQSWILHDVTPENISTMLRDVGKVFKTEPTGELIFVIGEKFVAEVVINQMIGRYELRASIFTNQENIDPTIAKFQECIKNKIDACTGATTVEIAWFFENKESSRHHDLTEAFFEIIHQEAYPYIPNIHGFMDEYLASESSILLMMGSAGTGKTRLLRYLIQYAGKKWGRAPKVVYTSDMKVLEDEWMFIEFRCEGYDFMVIEDIDEGLVSRKEGNKIVHKFLASSDGFVAARNKKIILSTNLFIKDIDDALVRPGRCFASIETGALAAEEATALAIKLGKKDAAFSKATTVAEVYDAVFHTASSVRMVKSKIGFQHK